MKKIIPYVTFALITGFSLISEEQVFAGGCKNHINKKAKIECPKNDTECQANKNNKYELDKTLNS